MQHENYHRQAPPAGWEADGTPPPTLLSRRQSLLAMLGAAALLAALAVGGAWNNARAAPQSGAPHISIVSITGNTLTLQFQSWAQNEIITLGYSSSVDCLPELSLPTNPPNTFSAEMPDFTATYDWPIGIGGGTYYLCATGSVSGGPIHSDTAITVNPNGMIQSTPGSGTTQPTSPSASGTSSPTGTTSPASTGSPSAIATGGSGDGGGPGNQGTQSNNGTSPSALAAIILLCVLVLGLLAYLVRIWLQGRRPSGGTQGP